MEPAGGIHLRAHPLLIGRPHLKLKILWSHVHSDQCRKMSSGALGIQSSGLFHSSKFGDEFVGSNEVIQEPLGAKVHHNESQAVPGAGQTRISREITILRSGSDEMR